MRGDGDIVRDVIASTLEFVGELHLGLPHESTDQITDCYGKNIWIVV